jgi:predicted nucleic acid-binding Zn finger protein
MTTKELQKRSERSQDLRVLKSDGNFFVESAEGMVLYKVNPTGEQDKYVCTCGDYARGIKNDTNFQCKHILAVLSCVITESAEFLERKRPKLDERFIKTIEGRDFVLYSGLLDLAHQKGLLKIEVDPLQYPTKDNGYFAICKATALSKFGEVFSDVGDANPTNCNAKVAKHLLRMASTRAKARALRDMDDIGMTCLEELGDLDEVIGEEANGEKSRRSALRKPARSPEAQPPQQSKAPAGEPKAEKGNGSGGANGSDEKAKPAGTKAGEPKTSAKRESKPEPRRDSKPDQPAPLMSSAQKNAIYNLSRRRGISVDDLEKMSRQNYGVSLENLSSANASTFIRTLQQSA